MLCILILLTLHFAQQKFLTLMKSSLIIILCIDFSSVIVFKKLSPYLRSFSFSLLLFLRSIVVLHFPLMSMIYYVIIFVRAG